MDQAARRAELNKLRIQVAPLESELIPEGGRREWPPRAYYTTYHILAGMVLGLAGAMTSLLFNIIGAAMVGGRDRDGCPQIRFTVNSACVGKPYWLRCCPVIHRMNSAAAYATPASVT